MVGTLQSASSSDSIPVSRPAEDARHNANFIKTATEEINGHKTDFIVEPFSDRIFVIVTQSQKMGTVILAEKERAIGGAEAFGVSVLMGKREVPELELCARRIISLMEKDGCTKPLLLSLGLKDHSMNTISAIIDKVKELRVW